MAKILTLMQGRPGDALHIRHRRAAVDVGFVVALPADDAEDAHRGGMARYAGRDRRVRYVLPVAVEVQLLLVDGNDDLQRTRGNIAEGPAADMLGRLLLVLGPAPVATPTVGLALSLLLPATIVVAVRLSDLPGRLVAVGAALPVRALFGRSTAVVAVGRPVVCSVRLYAAVAGIRVMPPLSWLLP